MNLGDNTQMGDAEFTTAGGDIHQVHNDLIEMGRILQYFTDALERQRKDDEAERRDRQRETDMYTAGVRSAIEALRNEQAGIRRWLSMLTGWLALLTLALGVILFVVLTRPYVVALIP